MNEWNSEKPSYNPPGQRLGANDIALRRTPTASLGASALIGDGWNIVKDKLIETVGGLLLAFGVSMGVQMVLQVGLYALLFAGMLAGAALSSVDETLGMVVTFAGMGIGYFAMIAVMVVVQTLAMAAYQLFLLRLVRGQETSFSDLNAIKPVIVPLLFVGLLNAVAVMAGYVLLIVPGVIIALGLAMANFVVLDKNLRAVEAMKASWRIMVGYKGKLFVLVLLIALLNFAGMLACGMGTLVTMPISMVAMAMFYNRIAEPGNAYMALSGQ